MTRETIKDRNNPGKPRRLDTLNKNNSEINNWFSVWNDSQWLEFKEKYH